MFIRGESLEVSDLESGDVYQRRVFGGKLSAVQRTVSCCYTGDKTYHDKGTFQSIFQSSPMSWLLTDHFRPDLRIH